MEILTLVIYFNINKNEKKEKSIHPITNKSKIQPEDLDRKEKLNQFSKPSIFQLIFAQEGTIEKKKTLQIGFSFPSRFSMTASSTGPDSCKVRASVRIAIVRHHNTVEKCGNSPFQKGRMKEERKEREQRKRGTK